MLQLERISFHYVYKFARRSRFSLSLASVSILYGTENKPYHWFSLEFTHKKKEVKWSGKKFTVYIFWTLESFYSVFFAHTHLSLSNYGFVAKNSNFIEWGIIAFFHISTLLTEADFTTGKKISKGMKCEWKK